MDLRLVEFLTVLLISASAPSRARLSDASDLDCSFDFPCRWFNGTNGLEDTVDWNTALAVTLSNWNNLPILGFSRNSTGSCLSEQMKTTKAPKIAFSADCAESQSLTFMATTKPETDVYSYAIGSTGSTAWLVSAEIPKQIGAGILSFSYWKSKNPPALRICGRKPPGYPNGLDCNWYDGNNQVQGQTWIQDRVIIPPSDVPFEIVIVAQFTESNSFIAIDDLQYRASIAGGSGGGSLSFANVPRRTSLSDQLLIPAGSDIVPLGTAQLNLDAAPQQKAAVLDDRQTTAAASASSSASKVIGAKLQVVIDSIKCPQVACDFDKSFCQYANIPSGGNWKRQNSGRVGTFSSGIATDFNGNGGYGYALQQVQSNSSFILSTPPFVINLPGILTFYYHMSTRTGRLQLCEPTLENCTVIAPSGSPDQAGWQSAEVNIPSGRHQLFFLADRLEQNGVIGLDNVQIWDKSKTFELECSRG